MHQAIAPHEVQRASAHVPAPGTAALLTEVVELRAAKDQLSRALASRSVIDQARGMVTVLAPCSTERAWGLLVDVSQHCNVKLRDVAEALVATAEGEPLPEQIRRELRRALRRLHAADRA
ncbi:ANTAR domain-containing protein [Streptomyces sp. NBC_01304]|uniref:ANTAR domain-containing protein n=1 Tax=Streptomyces sp. NBC_01304 TaxID=2903818 RepID=UPI002E120DCA|nr:ANTAR domain-containing protein [Streptomyces sp. NBC_01304]